MSLATVIGSPDLHQTSDKGFKQWSKNSDDPFSRMHAKFWGTSMEEEERASQRATSDDKDDKNSSGEDDDITPGCYLLDMDVGLEHRKIWIRADYIRIYDYVENYYNEKNYLPCKAPAVVITGQPGIGKSVWILYALRRCLAERRPVILYRSRQCYLFVEDGVYEAPANFDQTRLRYFVWTLVDTDEDVRGAPPELISHGSRMFVIYVTTPEKARWSRMHKTMRAITLIMNPWTRGEITRIAKAVIPHVPLADVLRVFDRFGPTPRLCIDYVADKHILDSHERDVQSTILLLTRPRIEQMLVDVSSLTMDWVSENIWLIRREDVLEIHSGAVVEPLTPFIQSRLASHFQKCGLDDQIRLYRFFARVDHTRNASGFLFEVLAQQILGLGCILNLVPMVLAKKNSDSFPRWYSSGTLLPAATTEFFPPQTSQQKVNVNVHHTVQYPSTGPSSITPNVLYVPEIANEEALDSFTMLDGFLYIFRFMVSVRCDIKRGLVDALERCEDVPHRKAWRLVFVMPPDQDLTCLRPRSCKLRELMPYTAVLDLSTLGGGLGVPDNVFKSLTRI